MNDSTLIHLTNGEILKSYPYESIFGVKKNSEFLNSEWIPSKVIEGIEVDPKRNQTDEELMVEFFLNYDFFTFDKKTFYSTSSVVKIEKSKTTL